MTEGRLTVHYASTLLQKCQYLTISAERTRKPSAGAVLSWVQEAYAAGRNQR